MDFVDDFRYYKNPAAGAEPITPGHEKFNALLAATGHCLCDEPGINTPDWIWEVAARKDPGLASGRESLKALALVESPRQLRSRKIFVLENFLHRV